MRFSCIQRRFMQMKASCFYQERLWGSTTKAFYRSSLSLCLSAFLLFLFLARLASSFRLLSIFAAQLVCSGIVPLVYWRVISIGGILFQHRETSQLGSGTIPVQLVILSIYYFSLGKGFISFIHNARCMPSEGVTLRGKREWMARIRGIAGADYTDESSLVYTPRI